MLPPPVVLRIAFSLRTCIALAIVALRAISPALLALALIAPALAEVETIDSQEVFSPADFEEHSIIPAGPPQNAPLAGMPFQDFTVQPPPRTFPNCRLPLLSWRLGPGPETDPYGPAYLMEVPAHAIRKARWYTAGDLVMLRHDAHDSQVFAQRGVFGLGPTALSSADLRYPLNAGGQFMIGHSFNKRLSFETTYLGSYNWEDLEAVRDNTPNGQGGVGTGLLSSPFTARNLIPVQGFDFNNLVSVATSDRLESLEMQFRYRPDMPYGAFDVSFLYGLRYLQIDESLGYHSESAFPAPGGAVNDLNVATNNAMIGAQLGLTMHFLILPQFWIDWDLKGGIYNNHASQRSVYQNIDAAGAQTSFANNGHRDDTSYSGDVRIISNFQILPQLTLRMGYQATFVNSVATAVGNFQSNVDIVRLGPGFLDTRDNVIYHGPVLGLQYVR